MSDHTAAPDVDNSAAPSSGEISSIPKDRELTSDERAAIHDLIGQVFSIIAKLSRTYFGDKAADCTIFHLSASAGRVVSALKGDPFALSVLEHEMSVLRDTLEQANSLYRSRALHTRNNSRWARFCRYIGIHYVR